MAKMTLNPPMPIGEWLTITCPRCKQTTVQTTRLPRQEGRDTWGDKHSTLIELACDNCGEARGDSLQLDIYSRNGETFIHLAYFPGELQ